MDDHLAVEGDFDVEEEVLGSDAFSRFNGIQDLNDKNKGITFTAGYLLYKRLTIAAANVISYVKTIPYSLRAEQHKVLKL